MLLGRMVTDKTTWLKAQAAAETDPDTIAPDAASFFMPSKADGGWLSVYSIASKDEAAQAAAAFRFNMGDLDACHFATADAERLTGSGLEIRKTLGKTFHPDVNDRHYEIKILTMRDLQAAVGCFAFGDYMGVEKSTLVQRLEQSALHGELDCGIFNERKVDGKVASRALELVRSEHLELRPNAA